MGVARIRILPRRHLSLFTLIRADQCLIAVWVSFLPRSKVCLNHHQVPSGILRLVLVSISEECLVWVTPDVMY